MQLRPRSKTETAFTPKSALLTIITPKASFTQLRPQLKPRLPTHNTETSTHADIHATLANKGIPQRPASSSNRKKYIHVVSRETQKREDQTGGATVNIDILHTLRKYLQENVKVPAGEGGHSANPFDTPIKKLSVFDDGDVENAEVNHGTGSYETMRMGREREKEKERERTRNKVFSIVQAQQQHSTSRSKIHMYSNDKIMGKTNTSSGKCS